MTRTALSALALSALFLFGGRATSAQVSAYYVSPARDNVPVYARPSPDAPVIDWLTTEAVLSPLDDPRDPSVSFVPVEPVLEYFGTVGWELGYVRRGDLAVSRGGAEAVATSRPLPRSRFEIAAGGLLLSTEAVTFRPGTRLEIEDVFGQGGESPSLEALFRFYRGAPSQPWTPTPGGMGELGVGYAPGAGVFHVTLMGGPTAGVQFGRALGLHATARGGGGAGVATRTPDSEPDGFSLVALWLSGEASAALTLGAVRQLRFEAGYRYASPLTWEYTEYEGDDFHDSGFDGHPVNMSAPFVRVGFSGPLGRGRATPAK